MVVRQLISDHRGPMISSNGRVDSSARVNSEVVDREDVSIGSAIAASIEFFAQDEATHILHALTDVESDVFHGCVRRGHARPMGCLTRDQIVVHVVDIEDHIAFVLSAHEVEAKSIDRVLPAST